MKVTQPPLFTQQKVDQAKHVPLAHQLRPDTLDEVEGHDTLINENSWLAIAMQEGRASSCIFWGPPGVGKTTLATLIAKTAKLPLTILSAVSAGKKEVQSIIDAARREQRTHLLFLDEIHRFNKAQQDVLLPCIEEGILILIGATTENPSFTINNALLSRCRVVVLQALQPDALTRILQRGLKLLQQQHSKFDVEKNALTWLASMADGDARYALNALEMLAELNHDQHWSSLEVQQQWGRKQVAHDRNGDAHYDLISALHKSVRDSDADASCYWLARMLEAGDEPRYLSRRLIRMASEDIGLADPKALSICLDAAQMFEILGSPEGEQGLFQAAIYLALAPKSNAVYMAEKSARKLAKQSQHLDVPIHLKNAPTRLLKDLGHGQDYQYAHDAPDAIVKQTHFPDKLAATTLYKPVDRGFERTLNQRMQWLQQRKDST